MYSGEDYPRSPIICVWNVAPYVEYNQPYNPANEIETASATACGNYVGEQQIVEFHCACGLNFI